MKIDLSNLEQKSVVEYQLASILNSNFISNNNKRDQSFGADDVIALQIEIENSFYQKFLSLLDLITLLLMKKKVMKNRNEHNNKVQNNRHGEVITFGNNYLVSGSYVKVVFQRDRSDIRGGSELKCADGGKRRGTPENLS